MNQKYITPSILNVDKNKRLDMVNNLIDNGIKWIHYDVMDGNFVPNHAIELEEIKNINENGKKHLKDAHLMITNPFEEIPKYKDLVDFITFHYEAEDPKKIMSFLQKNQHDYSLGIAIKPDTKVEEIKDFLPYLRLVLVMSVEPGKGGQKFIPTAIDKIKKLKNIRSKYSYQYIIQVDGGINNETCKDAWKAGADALVAGTYIVKEPTRENIETLLNKK
ncbi:ribulose-phosphate 3-epimerase [Mycoplasma sp. Mirounga ES2805-ORL]|uniref:ribulose-phosphate 3-epimerase n=1 Tax=Mycoplasma sp. Mirounga ES2805-ORL TaxID=754514 RepID=UPI00197C9804|nr:ribulose-phosphate 3-epimerase [Mycoplasma sp. Mirounga ES2805-ORL]QSF13445.1 ribulose-phosphate 3-epimerase [Mycoplasma sp. Mirounga ES2805-ORL]